MKKMVILLVSIAIIVIIPFTVSKLIQFINSNEQVINYPNMEGDELELCVTGEGCTIKDDRTIGFAVGDRFPNLELTDASGQVTKLYDMMEGKEKFVVNLSTDWCGDCQREKDKLEVNYEQMLEDKIGVAVIYINLSKDDDKRSTNFEQIQNYLIDSEYSFPTFIDYEDSYKDMVNVTSIPVNFVLNKNAVVKAHAEEIDLDNLILANEPANK